MNDSIIYTKYPILPHALCEREVEECLYVFAQYFIVFNKHIKTDHIVTLRVFAYKQAYHWAVVVAKWSACSHSTLMI